MDFYDFPYIGNFIIPTDFHIFQRDWNHQPVYNHKLWGCLKLGICHYLTHKLWQFWLGINAFTCDGASLFADKTILKDTEHLQIWIWLKQEQWMTADLTNKHLGMGEPWWTSRRTCLRYWICCYSDWPSIIIIFVLNVPLPPCNTGE